MFFPVKFAKVFRIPPPVATSVLSKDFLDVSYENSHIHARRLFVAEALIYFLNAISFWFVECFPVDRTLTLTTLECFRICSVFSLPLMAAIMENSRHCIN